MLHVFLGGPRHGEHLEHPGLSGADGYSGVTLELPYGQARALVSMDLFYPDWIRLTQLAMALEGTLNLDVDAESVKKIIDSEWKPEMGMASV